MDATTISTSNPLLEPCRNGDSSKVKALLDAQDEESRKRLLNEVFEQHRTLFHIAAEQSNWRVLRELLLFAKTLQIDLNRHDVQGNTCLYFVMCGYFDLLKIRGELLDHVEKAKEDSSTENRFSSWDCSNRVFSFHPAPPRHQQTLLNATRRATITAVRRKSTKPAVCRKHRRRRSGSGWWNAWKRKRPTCNTA